MTPQQFEYPVLTTKRLTLRAPEPCDLAAYKAFYATSDVHVGGYAQTEDPATVSAKLEHDIAHWAERGSGMFILRRTGDPTVLGGVGLAHPTQWPSHELTWWLMADARGHGYASEASRAVINWAYTALNWTSVETHMRDENDRAHALARRLGGTVDRRHTFPDGVTRDVYVLPRQEELV